MGRVANRIKNGGFELGGKAYTLATNNDANHLHGGEVGWSHKLWRAEVADDPRGPAIRFALSSPDGDEGYPGAVEARVLFVLTATNELVMEHTATADASTPINMCNHSYWNLAGHGSGTVEAQTLSVRAERYTPKDETSVPTGEIAPLAGSPLDLRTPRSIGDGLAAIRAEDPDEFAGYDHNYVIDGEAGELRHAATLEDPASGRVMEVRTDQAGVQVYSANYVAGLKGKGGATYPKFGGVCLETQMFPDAINKQGVPGWPDAVLRPGEEYRHVVVHAFSTK